MTHLNTKTIIAVILIAGIIYLAGGFIAMEFNPAKWHELGRVFAVAFWIWGIVGIFKLNEEKKV